jgi:hypothetical protein
VTLVDAQNVRQQLRAGAEGKSAQESRDIGIEVINEAEEQIALAGNTPHTRHDTTQHDTTRHDQRHSPWAG